MTNCHNQGRNEMNDQEISEQPERTPPHADGSESAAESQSRIKRIWGTTTGKVIVVTIAFVMIMGGLDIAETLTDAPADHPTAQECEIAVTEITDNAAGVDFDTRTDKLVETGCFEEGAPMHYEFNWSNK